MKTFTGALVAVMTETVAVLDRGGHRPLLNLVIGIGLNVHPPARREGLGIFRSDELK